MIPALVLTAGLATRLRPLSLLRAKAALPVGGEALVRRILRSLREKDVSVAVLNLHHLPHTLTGLVGDGSDLGLHVRYSWEDPVLGSAGGPRRALPLLGDQGTTFLIVNGDTLTDVDVRAVLDTHRRTGALVTMAVVPQTAPSKYGGLVADADGNLTDVAPAKSDRPSYHFIGVQVADIEAFKSVPEDRPYESVTALYPALIASRKGAVRLHVCNAEFLDIGTPDDYRRTSCLISSREDSGPGFGSRVQIDPSARVEDSVLWDNVEVHEGALVRQCVVTDGVRVPADTSWIGVTLRPASDALVPGEKRIGDLAVSSL